MMNRSAPGCFFESRIVWATSLNAAPQRTGVPFGAGLWSRQKMKSGSEKGRNRIAVGTKVATAPAVAADGIIDRRPRTNPDGSGPNIGSPPLKNWFADLTPSDKTTEPTAA